MFKKVVIPMVALVLNEYWYVYQLGYFKAFFINRIEREVESEGNLCYILCFLALAVKLFYGYIIDREKDKRSAV